MNDKFCKLMKEVLARRDLTPIAKLVHAYYVDCASSEGLAWPNRDTVARGCGVSPDAVKLARKQLIGIGLMERWPAGGRGSGCVRMAIPLCNEPGKYSPVEDEQAGKYSPATGQILPGKGVNITRPKGVYKEGTNSRTNSGTNSLLIEFDAWWDLYPRKVGKQAAKGVYQRVRKTGVAAEVLLAAVAEQCKTIWADAIRSGNQTYIPHPRTWLNQGRWEDEIVEQNPTASEAPRESIADRARRLFGEEGTQ